MEKGLPLTLDIFQQTFRLMLKPSSVIWKQRSLLCACWPYNSCSRDAFVGFWKYDMIVPSVRVQSRVPDFDWRRVSRGYWLRNQRSWRFQSSCCDWNGGHGLQLWSFDQNLPLPFCAPQFGSLMIFLFGHSTKITLCAIDFVHYA